MRRRGPTPVRLAFATVLPAVLMAGCAHGESVADRHAREMAETIAKLQADQDRTDRRLGDLEVALAEEKSPTRPRASNAPASPTPPLRVVQIGAPEEASPDPDEASGRPEIRATGTPGRTTRGRDPSPLGGPRSSALDPEAKKTYEGALALVQRKDYDRGLDALASFLVKYPDHPFAENALYWRGEAFFAKGEYARAIEQFEAVLARFGAGSKAPDSLLKLGMCHDKLGARDRAREFWERLRSDYPRSEAARKAPLATSAKGPKESR